MKAYFFELDDYEGSGIAIIAENTKEARKIAVHYNDDYNYVEMCSHIKLMKNADTSDLTKGIVDDQVTSLEGVRRGLYGWTIGKCAKCNEETELYLQDNGDVCCNHCYEDRAIIQQPLQPDNAPPAVAG